MKKHSQFFLFFIYALLVAERFYGIWFLRWAFDEEQNFGGGTAILKWVLNLFGTNIHNPEMEHLVSIYGIVGKYLAVVPAAMGFALEKIFSIDLPIPLGLIFTRIVVSFLPSILTIVLIHKMIRLVSDSEVFLFSALTLFLFTFKHIETAHYGVSDALSTFFVVGSIYAFLRFSLEGKRKFLVWTAMACVFCVSTKINVGVVITGVIGVLLLVQWMVDVRRKTANEKSRNLANSCKLWQRLKRTKHKDTETQNLLIFGFTWIAFFVLVNLPYLVNFEEWYGELVRHIREYPYTIKGGFLTPFYFHPPFGVGWGILGLAFIGVILWWTGNDRRKTADGRRKTVDGRRKTVDGRRKTVDGRRKTVDGRRWGIADFALFLPAVLFLVLFYVYLAFSRGVIHRWTIPMTPFLVLFAAFALEYFWYKCNLIWGKHKALPLLVVLLLGLQPLYQVLQFDLALTASPTTYQKLQNFIEGNIAAHSNSCIYNVEGIELKYCREEAPVSVEALKESDVEYVVFSDFWFSEKRYPTSILYLEVIDERTHGNWRRIRDFIEGENSGWKLEEEIRPDFFSDWSTNIAQPPVFYIYRRAK